jgi:Protein of unknown function (DUF4235)
MNLMYKPFSVVNGLVASRIAARIFRLIWGLIDDREPPSPEHRDVPLWKLGLALVMEGALFTVFRGVIDHVGRQVFHYFTGEWPGEERPEPLS